MSRPLPVRANLEHLKNQAKDRLRDLQQRTPSATLSDALHTVAQEYGFKTWPELKEHVESVDRGAVDLYKRRFGRYNMGARRALFFCALRGRRTWCAMD